MRYFQFVILLSLLAINPAIAGKNASGALIVHTDDARPYYRSQCIYFEDWVPQDCEELNTRTDVDVNTSILIWFIAAFDPSSSPGVTSIYFGNNHNLPADIYHNSWSVCGPDGTIEHPDPGWPNDPASAGNWVEFGSPIVGDRFFTFYRVDVWGLEGTYYGLGPHPSLGYASFVDDSSPPQTDSTQLFGQVRWYEPGYNVCPGVLPEEMVACCFGDGGCEHVTISICADLGGEAFEPGSDCDPNPCPQGVLGVCCFPDGDCSLETPLDCAALEGVFHGDEPACDPNPCPQPPEAACCLQTGECRFVTEPQCAEFAGTFLGDVTACEPNPCYGACCFYNGDCQMQALYWCEPMGGEFMGADTDCDPNPCDPTSGVPEQMIHESTWGTIKARYR